MRLEATNKNVRGGAKLAPPPSQVGLIYDVMKYDVMRCDVMNYDLIKYQVMKYAIIDPERIEPQWGSSATPARVSPVCNLFSNDNPLSMYYVHVWCHHHLAMSAWLSLS